MAKEFERDLKADQNAPEEIEKKLNSSRERILAAPAIIIVNVDLSEMDHYPDERRNKAEYLMAAQSVANAGMQMLLAAHAEGVGSVWVCSPLFAQEAVQKALGLPKTWEPHAMIFLGYANTITNKRERKLQEDVVVRR